MPLQRRHPPYRRYAKVDCLQHPLAQIRDHHVRPHPQRLLDDCLVQPALHVVPVQHRNHPVRPGQPGHQLPDRLGVPQARHVRRQHHHHLPRHHDDPLHRRRRRHRHIRDNEVEFLLQQVQHPRHPRLGHRNLGVERLLRRDQPQPRLHRDRHPLQEQPVHPVRILQRDAQARPRPRRQHQRDLPTLDVEIHQRDVPLHRPHDLVRQVQRDRARPDPAARPAHRHQVPAPQRRHHGPTEMRQQQPLHHVPRQRLRQVLRDPQSCTSSR